jgi:preprotein translocase subunit SecG
MIITLLWILFVVSALLLCLLILIQEGKGGGLAEAFGGQGAETFGVKATGVNYFTGILAGVLFLTAILINKCGYQTTVIKVTTDGGTPATSTDTGGAPGGAPGGGSTTGN